MPYSSISQVPKNVPKEKRKQWMEVWNSAHSKALEDGKSAEEAESSAFAQANSVAGPNSKVAKEQSEKFNQLSVGYEAVSTREGQHCDDCVHFISPSSCEGVAGDISAKGWCLRFDPTGQGVGNKAAFVGRKAMTGNFQKFIPFAKVDAAKREVWGIVTAEIPDKDDEVCDYFKSKPYYEEVIAEMSKATDGGNFMPLRQMHSTDLPVAGKSIGYELRDADREVFMGFKVTDEKAWQNVEDKVYTGFSHGGVKVGEMVPDPVYKNCLRYVAKPAEVSLVDNPCLGVAHFQYIYKTGESELRKNRSIVEATVTLAKFSELEKKVELLSKSNGIPIATPVVEPLLKKTKRVAGEDLPSSAFLIVGDSEKTDTWHLPVKFSTDAKSKRHVINAMARLGQVKGITTAQREEAKKKLASLAEKYGIDAEKEKTKLAAIFAYLRKGLRARVNRLARVKGDPGHTLTFLDNQLGQLAKGMYEVGALAQHVGCLSSLLCQIIYEEEWEKDDSSSVPAMLEGNVNELLDTLIALVEEEAQELREDLAAKV